MVVSIMKYIAPKPYAGSFTCPHCGSIAQQHWWDRKWDEGRHSSNQYNVIRVGTCTHCSNSTLWVLDQMVYPQTGTAPSPNTEMPDAVKRLYLEAAAIQSKSPRGAGALLRLGVQVLCKELGEKGKNINEDVKSLVSKGLPPIVQQSLDVLRVTGNEAVHPGQIDTDDSEVVGKLFELLNIVVEYMIAMPKRVSGIFSGLPASAKDAISKRDQN
jgi:hypothetical protein